MKIQGILKQKTTWAGLAAVATAAEQYFTGGVDLSSALQLGFGGLIAIFMRQGIAKTK